MVQHGSTGRAHLPNVSTGALTFEHDQRLRRWSNGASGRPPEASRLCDIRHSRSACGRPRRVMSPASYKRTWPDGRGHTIFIGNEFDGACLSARGEA